MKHYFSLIIVMSFLVTPVVYSQVQHQSVETKMDSIFQAYNYKVPGCAVAIVSNGKTVFNKGYGMADIEHNIPISPTTVFDVASLSKQFTGLAISSLVQGGKIFADDDIRKYLPLIPDFGKRITIYHLLHHTSGLRDWPEALGIAGWRNDDACSFEDIMRFAQHQKELEFEPGTRFSYSNTGYNLLAAIVEKVSGKTFAQWSYDHILSPLKMDASLMRENHRILINNLAGSYVLRENKITKSLDLLSAYGSSSFFTSLKDMIRWANHFDEQVSKKDPVYTRMLKTGRLTNGDAVDYGFGLRLNKDGTLERVTHSGSWAGFRSMITYYPDKHLSVIILSNSGDFTTSKFSESIADVMLQREAPPVSDMYDLKKAPDVTVAGSLAEKYVGTYQLDKDWYITITMENNRLKCRTNGECPYPMVAKSDSTYWIDAYNNAVTFVTDNDQYLLKFKTIVSKRITPLAPLNTEQLKQYAGRYYSSELATEYRMTVSDGKLMMYHIRLGDIELFPDPVKDCFGSKIGKFRFVRNNKNEIPAFELSGSRVRNIRFNKQSCVDDPEKY